jgi:hypothetical protein
MKLTDLEPNWISIEGRIGQGMHFLCPACNNGVCRLAVFFANPIDGLEPYPTPMTPGNTHRWQRDGATFDVLTLHPSINSPDHWHGWIRNGEVTNA